MISYIWRSWWRHPERFLLLLIGMLTISSTLSYFVGITESSNGTTQDILQKRWKAPYHIVVRPQGSHIVTEQDNLLEPNYLSGLYEGISLADYEWIKSMADVEVAAPLAPVGYSATNLLFGKIEKPKEPGIYRHFVGTYSNDGVQITPKRENTRYYTVGLWSLPGDYQKTIEQYGVENWTQELYFGFNQLLVGIDPQAEAKLVGLDRAVAPLGNSRYFTDNDEAKTTDVEENRKVTALPILMSNRMDTDLRYVSRYERLDAPFLTKEEANRTMEEVKQQGGIAYLNRLKSAGEPLAYSFDTKQAYHLFISSFSGIDATTGKPFLSNIKNGPFARIANSILEIPSPVPFQKDNSPYPERWNNAYRVAPVQPSIPADIQWFYLLTPENYRDSFRPAQFSERWNTREIEPYWIGFYDPEKLSISKDPVNELPMETYRPAVARLVLDKDGKPVNPPIPLKPSDNPFGLLTSPPLLLTTLDGAAQVLGDKPISSIRLKIKGVENVSEESQQKLEAVVKEIEKRTGLLADITLGSSPQPVIVHVTDDEKTVGEGWIEQFFVKLGTVFTLFHETKMGFSGIMAIVMLVAVSYVFATNLVTLYARTGEFGLLLAVGWRPAHVMGVIFTEACLLGGFASLLSWAIVGAIVLQQQTEVPPERMFFIGLCGFLIYVLAAVPVALLVNKMSALSMMKSGELQPASRRLVRVQGIFSLALGHVLARFRRSLLSVFAMAVPTGLLVFFGFVTYRLQGVMYTSWLGQYVAVEIGNAHYVAMILALLIAVLTTAEIIWQNVMERRAELLLFKAIGWRNGAIIRGILWEGFVCGLFAAIFGLVIGFGVIAFMYGQFPVQDALVLSGAGVIPIVVGVLGALFPAVMAVRLRPLEGIRGSQKNRRNTERLLRVAVIVLAIACVAGAMSSAIRLWQQPSQQAVGLPNSINKEPHKLGNLEGFVAQPVPDGSKGSYHLSFRMDKDGKFTANATIQVENRSDDTWDKLMFYFIPSVFTKENKPAAVEGTADVSITSVELDQRKTSFKLSSDTLAIPLEQEMAPGEKREVTVAYTFTAPEGGVRFERAGQRYYLAQAYPMLATYHDGWNKQDYRISSESYDTAHADYTVSYDIPPGYQFISSSDEDAEEPKQRGEVAARRVREVFAAVVKDVTAVSQTIDGVQIRVFGEPANKQQMDEALQTAAQVVPFLSGKLGKYPMKQLDIMLDGRANMEYPGIFTVTPHDGLESLRWTVVHEIAHQWFYGIVANDSYHDSWLDEGLTELTTAMYFQDHDKKKEEDVFAKAKMAASIAKGKPSNLPLDQYNGETYGAFYAVPSLRLWELISSHGGLEEGWHFLRAYQEHYAYQQVDTKEFVRFASTYFPVDEAYFSGWLQL